MDRAPRHDSSLSVPWREWLAGSEWPQGELAVAFDAIVIGSGYGGSVAALRLAQKGYRTLVLERGGEYLPGDFPNDFGLVPKALRVNIPTESLPAGRASGLLELHLGQGMVAITGNGLGGGSLVNAGVAIRPDADVFAQTAWPSAIRSALCGGLEPWFDQARQALRATRWSSELPGDGGRLRKTQALERLGTTWKAEVKPMDLTIDPRECIRCGDCASGCNVPGAKQTLAHTYLHEAEATGLVRIVTQAEVYRFAPGTGTGDDFRWEVHVFGTDAQHQFTATRDVFAETQAAKTHRVLRAPLLFVCAGTLGSTQLLQRSQARAGGKLSFSRKLGEQVSGNGDSLGWVVDEPEVVSSVGRGQLGVDEWDKAACKKAPYAAEKIVGPTITAAADLRDPSLGLDQRVLVQDGAVPRAIALVARELLATARTLQHLDRWWYRKPTHAGASREDPLAASAAMAQHSQVLLAMGHDGSPARLVWLEGSDRTAPFLPDPQELPSYKAQQRLFDKLGARHVHLPLWSALPRTAADLMEGPKPSPTVTTVHPLGGCVMADRPEDGVVDDLGRVWVQDVGAPEIPAAAIETDSEHAGGRLRPHRYRGLHVLDGSIVPTALGCNPLLTITALAERALDAVPRKEPAREPMARAHTPRAAPLPAPSPELPIDASLNEALVATDLRLHGALARALQRKTTTARLVACFATGDLPAMLTRQRHELRVEATLWLDAKVLRDGELRDEPVQYKCTDGQLALLPAHWASSGIWPFLSTMAQLFVLVVSIVSVFGWYADPWWASLLRRVGLLLALVLVLPLPRAAITWLVIRGWRDYQDSGQTRPVRERVNWFFQLAWSMLRQMVHASEKRVMRYRVSLRRQSAPHDVDAPEFLELLGTKRVVYRASIAELLRWIGNRFRGRKTRIRDTFWEQVMDADVHLLPAARTPFAWTWAHGRFRMGFENLAGVRTPGQSGLRGTIELGSRGDTSTGLLAAAGYPLLFLRFALKTRMLDFRLPNYSGRPTIDSLDKAPELLLTGKRTKPDEAPRGRTSKPELHWVTPVPRGQCRSDSGDEPNAPLRLPLWRYRQRDAAKAATPCEVVPGTWNGVPVARAKAVLLLHAFGQSGLSYTFQTTRQNLAERFLRQGYEVWILEMRMSTRSGYTEEPCTVDQLGEHDIPCTVDHILDCLREESRDPDLRQRPWQIAAYSHCIGSAAMWMALLRGSLSHDIPAANAEAGDARLSKLSHLMSSQLHPWVVGARGSQAKTWVPALLSKLWRRGSVPFAVRGPQQGFIAPLMDRVFGSLPAPLAEDRRPAGATHDDASATCRRIRYIDAPLFDHAHVNDATMAIMNQLFGDANLRLFGQARRFIERRRLVDEDGINVYVTDERIGRHLAFPIQLLHGEDNQLFDVAGAETTFERLGRHHGGWQRAFCTGLDGQPGFLRIPGYGHLDPLIGQRAHIDVYRHVVRFFRQAHEQVHHAAVPGTADRWSLRAPRLGPFVGWVREDKGEALVRVSFMPEDGGRGELPTVRLRYWCREQLQFVTWKRPVEWQAYDDGTVVRMLWADLRVPLQDPPEHWQLLVFLPTHALDEGPEQGPKATDDQLEAWIDSVNEADRVPHTQPPLAPTDRHMKRAEFRLPPVTFESLAQGQEVMFAAASCRHPGLGLDQQRIDHAVQRFLTGPLPEQVAFATLLGDQIYADATAGLVDPRSPVERFHERHETAFARDRLGELLAALPVYMTPDDHEWIDNYPLGSPLMKRPWPQWTDPALPFDADDARVAAMAAEAVRAFQRLQSPNQADGLAQYDFRHGCTRVFALDTRSQRQRNRAGIVPDLADLKTWLRDDATKDALNVVMCGSVVLPGLEPGSDPGSPGAIDTWQQAPEQRRELLELLVTHARGRFLLLSGDYHVSGAALLAIGDEVVGAAVIAPPLYAPLLYANSTPASVFTAETIDLGASGLLRMQVPAGGEFAPGSGLGFVSVRTSGPGIAITYQRKLWVWEQGVARDWACDLGLPARGSGGDAASRQAGDPASSKSR